MPRRRANSMALIVGVPSAQMPSAPMFALHPPASAVAAAAESVDNESAACVVITPTLPCFMILSTMTKPSLRTCRLYCRAISKWVMPPPSERKKKTYLGMPDSACGWLCAEDAGKRRTMKRIMVLQKPTSRSSLRMINLAAMIESSVDETRAKAIAPYSKLERTVRQTQASDRRAAADKSYTERRRPRPRPRYLATRENADCGSGK